MAERRFRHGLQDSSTCVLCDQESHESMDHILIGCSFSREVWSYWLTKLRLDGVIVVQQEPPMQWWLCCRKLVSKMLRRGFDSFFFLLGWLLWKERNVRTFGGVASSPVALQNLVHQEIDEWCVAGYKHLSSLVALASD